VTKTVLLDNPVHPKAMEVLAQGAQVLGLYQASLPELRQALADVQAAIVSTRFPISRNDIVASPHLKVIGRPGAGVDSVDVHGASELGVPVVYTPEGPTESVVEHALCFMLMLAKQMRQGDAATRRGDFSFRTRIQASELQGKTLGLVGGGHIGSRLAQACRLAFDMRVLIYDPYLTPSQAASCGAELCPTLQTVLSESDFVSIHAPMTPETKGLIGRQQIGWMKPSAFLVNTSRGPLLDEAALVEALQQHRIAGAGLDVYEKEPPSPNSPLFGLDNVVLSPHTGGFTDEGRYRMGMTVVEQVLQVLRGERPRFLANPEVWERRRVDS
jgi:D-3-phosphoglycerate dehydrogenase